MMLVWSTHDYDALTRKPSRGDYLRSYMQ